MAFDDDSGREATEVINGSLFSGSDSKEFNRCFDQVQGIDHVALVLEVLGVLNDPTRRNAVERLARRLCDAVGQGEDKKRQLTSAEIAEVLANGT